MTPLAVRVPWQRLERIPIACNGNRGYYVVDSGTCICCCVACTDRAKRADLSCSQISPTEFERHSGADIYLLTAVMIRHLLILIPLC